MKKNLPILYRISPLLHRAFPDYEERFPSKKKAKTPEPPRQSSLLNFLVSSAFILLIYFLFVIKKIHKKKTVSKTEIANYYGVDRKTLNKWVLYFGKEFFPDYDDYLSQKRLTELDAAILKYVLGNPKKFPVMSKKQIIKEREGTYSSLRECVKTYPHLYGLTFKAFLNLKKFPPKVSAKIIKAYD